MMRSLKIEDANGLLKIGDVPDEFEDWRLKWNGQLKLQIKLKLKIEVKRTKLKIGNMAYEGDAKRKMRRMRCG